MLSDYSLRIRRFTSAVNLESRSVNSYSLAGCTNPNVVEKQL
jgi:hypothetical protein